MKVWCYHCSKPFDIEKEGDYPCPFCGKRFEDLNQETKKAVRNVFRQFRFTTKQVVIWKEGDNVIIWNPKRTPALGWNNLTLLEALSDSAKTSLSIGNIERCQNQLNNILKILRNGIKHSKKLFKPLIQRCEFRETERTRCNKTPIKGILNGMNLCEYHFNLISKDNSQKSLEVYL